MSGFKLSILILVTASAWAQDVQDAQTPPAEVVAPAASMTEGAAETPVPTASPLANPEVTPAPRPPAKRINREKEAEGSEAKNRFTSDPIVKSQYRVGGQALEVDPD